MPPWGFARGRRLYATNTQIWIESKHQHIGPGTKRSWSAAVLPYNHITMISITWCLVIVNEISIKMRKSI